MLPFEPESDARLARRFSDALDKIWECEEIAEGQPRPELLREHVFDSTDGMRLIISRDRVKASDVVTYLHVSASLAPGTQLPLYPPGILDLWLLTCVQSQWQRISGKLAGLSLIGYLRAFSIPKEVPHILIPWGVVQQRFHKGDSNGVRQEAPADGPGQDMRESGPSEGPSGGPSPEHRES